MSDNKERIKGLQARIDDLARKQQGISRELDYIYKELERLKSDPEKTEPHSSPPITPVSSPTPVSEPSPPPRTTTVEEVKVERKKTEIEKWIGENLIAAIGIAVIIIGVGFGAKYAFDNNLVSPAVRIISGYVLGVALGLLGLKLKNKYEDYSAYLVGGAFAIVYFITFAAYSYYSFIPQLTTFIIMVIITAGAVGVAAWYGQQVIALFGMVGAYAVPFLVSEDTGNVAGLFTYVLIINIGILSLSLRQYWKWVYYLAFVFTWGIYLVWRSEAYEDDFNTAFYFGLGFFVIFYLTYMGYKLIRNESFIIYDVILVILNAFVFYGAGYTLFEELQGKYSLGLFTISNSIIHLMVAMLIQSRGKYDKAANRLVVGLAALFAVIAIPIQFDGSWVTLVWSGMAVVLVYVARSRDKWYYELIAYPILALSFFSLLLDWAEPMDELKAFLNFQFLSNFIYTAAFLFMFYFRKLHQIDFSRFNGLDKFMDFAIGAILMVCLFFLFQQEITHLFRFDSDGMYNSQIKFTQFLVSFCYAMIYATVLQVVNQKRLNIKNLGIGLQAMSFFIVLMYLTVILSGLGTFREIYLVESRELYFPDAHYLYTRYLVLAIFAGFYYSLDRSVLSDKYMVIGEQFRTLLFNIVLIWVLSAEVIHWIDISGIQAPYKLGLSLLWGLYAVFAVISGIKLRNKYLRLGGMALFAVTLFKVFFYDAASLNTLSKTILFIALGILLLVTSYLYFRFRDKLWKE